MFQYENERDIFSICSNENEKDDEGEILVEELLKKQKKGQKGRRGEWTEDLADYLADVILENYKYKEKLLLTNVKIAKNGQYHDNDIEELKKM